MKAHVRQRRGETAKPRNERDQRRRFTAAGYRVFQGRQERLATIEVGPAAFERCRATPADSEEIINHPRSIAGVDAVAFFKQWEPGTVQVSLRSKGDVDVRRVAAKFGGGGHTNAAGCTFNGQLPVVREQVIAELIRLLEESP